jgi:hypothetical protein
MNNLNEQQKSAVQAYLMAEANLMRQIYGSVKEINEILKGIAERNGETQPLKNYFSREDYKTFFGIEDDKLIDAWIYYCKKVINDNDIVDNMRDKSYLKQGPRTEKPIDQTAAKG